MTMAPATTTIPDGDVGKKQWFASEQNRDQQKELSSEQVTKIIDSILSKDFDSLGDDKIRQWVWGDSKQSNCGMLNLLTPEVVLEACKSSVKTGERTSLNWDINSLKFPEFHRIAAHHKIIKNVNGLSFDDEFNVNFQSSTQWDGFRHVAIVPKGTTVTEKGYDFNGTTDFEFYNGIKTSDIESGKTDRCGAGHWADKGIVGRGVLLDYVEYAKRKGIKYSTLETHNIKVSELEEIAKEKNITFKPGDILLVRTGFMEEYLGLDEKAQEAVSHRSPVFNHAGVEQSEETLRFIWNNHFAAVGGDAVTFEAWPPQNFDYFLHSWLLSGWGVPIGEMLDLRSLAKICHEKQRYTFFFTSSPIKQMDAIASPCNALCIF